MSGWKNPPPLPKEERGRAARNAFQRRYVRNTGNAQVMARTARRVVTPLEPDAAVACADSAELSIAEFLERLPLGRLEKS